jgi:hypothetical protein
VVHRRIQPVCPRLQQDEAPAQVCASERREETVAQPIAVFRRDRSKHIEIESDLIGGSIAHLMVHWISIEPGAQNWSFMM